MNILNSIINCAVNKKILLMLSGGKDSITTLILLKEANLDVTAIHFSHRWSPDFCKEEAAKFCQKYQVPLIIRDFTNEFLCGVSGYLNGRPCLLCKKEMYKIVLDEIIKGRFNFLAIGDNKNDRTSIARMNAYISKLNFSETLECNSYFGSEMGIVLPAGAKMRKSEKICKNPVANPRFDCLLNRGERRVGAEHEKERERRGTAGPQRDEPRLNDLIICGRGNMYLSYCKRRGANLF